MTAYLRSPCCGAAVVGMIDVTVHPRYRTDGSVAQIMDSLADVKLYVATTEGPDPHEAYCVACGESVDVPHECREPWRHGEGEA